MTPAPKRRWFRFSLRTLFVVVTVLCLWLGWNVHQVQQRKEWLEYIQANGAAIWSEEPPRRTTRSKNYPADHLPLIRRLLGAHPIGTIQLSHGRFTEDDLARVTGLFPEADVSIAPNMGGFMKPRPLKIDQHTVPTSPAKTTESSGRKNVW